LRKLALRQVASGLAASGTTWSGDDDPQLVGDALPFALKTHESLLAELPEDVPLLIATCRGFASYAAGWIEPAGRRLENDDFLAARSQLDRARRLHLRALDYCLRALDLRYPGSSAALRQAPEGALSRVTSDDVGLLYWTGASWGSAISLGLDDPALVADLPAVRAIFARALELEPGYDRGALHEAMISLESVSELLGGSPERARHHLDAALALSHGQRAGALVSYARGVLVAQQDRKGFREMLERALAIDPEASPADRLAIRLAQREARRLLDDADRLFFSEE